MMTADEALAWLLARAKAVEGTEEVAVEEALGRVLAENVAATVSAPPLDNSAMDGYAVRLADLDPEGETTLPVSQRIPAGHVGQPLAQGTAARIFTGAPVPPGADAVVMQEHCTEADGRVTVQRVPKVGANVRRAGEDFAAGATVLLAGTRLGPQHQGLAAAAGHARLKVARRLKVAAFFTGDEIVMPGEPLKPGQIYNSNRFTLRGLLQGLGCEVVDLGIVPDRFDATVDVLRQGARQADAVITSGGVSVGEEDHVKAAVESIGKLTMWKVAMKPGKPLAFGELDGAFFLGLPGNPVSAFVTFCLFVRPFLLRCQGVQQVAPAAYTLPAAFEWKKPGDRREFARARLDIGEDGAPVATLYPNQSSGALSSVAWANGLVELPEGKTVERGQGVKFIPFSGLLS
ncbi:MAG: gephyrin-like molybdotransferase Glp [Sulfuricellaceae bacterium]|jgi:molybdopterin molybdotransferase